MLDIKFEHWLKDKIDYDDIIPVNGGLSSASIYKVNRSNEDYYLKILRNDITRELEYEYNIYSYLENKIGVPKTIFFDIYEDISVHCITEVKGKLLEDYDELKIKDFIDIYAKGLNELHRITIEDCNIENGIVKRINDAELLLEENDLSVNCEYFDYITNEIKVMSKSEIHNFLLTNIPKEHDVCFTHGDYCFDNIIVEEENIKFIDLGRGGLADRYQDISIAVRCLHKKFGYEYLDYFFESYGLSFVDKEKLNYYLLLDELF